MTADLEATRQANLGGRARIERQLSEQRIAVDGISAENTTINGRIIAYGFPAAGGVTTRLANIDRSFLNVATELSPPCAGRELIGARHFGGGSATAAHAAKHMR